MGHGNVVGIAGGYGLMVRGSFPGGEGLAARFSALVQTGPLAHPASCAMETWFLSQGKAAGQWL